MTNYPFHNIEDFDDIEVKNSYKARGPHRHQVSEDEYFATCARPAATMLARPCSGTTPPTRGFTTGPKAMARRQSELQRDQRQPGTRPTQTPSITTTQKMIALRKSAPALIYGDYKDIDPDNPSIFAYTRILGADKYLVVLNLSKAPVTYALPLGLKAGELVVSNMTAKESQTNKLSLQPWEARVYKVN